MGYLLRVELTDLPQLLTFRTINSAIWFENDVRVRYFIHATLAKYATIHGVILYCVRIMGNHIHVLALFPQGNRADFMRDFKAAVARFVKEQVNEFPGGPLWERRYGYHFLPNREDLENYFFYLALNPVHHGLVARISDYEDKSPLDAIYGRKKTYKVLKRGEYRSKKRFNPNLRPQGFEEEYTLEYARLPGHENKSHSEYVRYMLSKLEECRHEMLALRASQGKKGFLGAEGITKIPRGAIPKKTKRSKPRTVVLSLCREAKKRVHQWYLAIWDAYKEASKRYRGGDRSTVFPTGTYPPWLPHAPTTCEALG